MSLEEPELEALLDSVANHGRVDWEDIEARANTPEDRSRIRELRDVARLADFHRSLRRGAAPAGRREVEAWGDLLLLEPVGSGTSGDVFRAWDPTLQREVALKLLRGPEGENESWLEEARALARVREPHVLTVHGAAVHEGRAGLWMEFLRGPTLEETIETRGPLSPAEVTRIGAQLARALSAVHAAGALHRDLKPGNVVLEADGRAVLTDFGLGRRSSLEWDARPFSGTPLFMSPQRLAGAPAKATDDLYALGITLRWVLTGAPPFSAASIKELRAAVAAGPVRRLRDERPDAPAALVAAIDRAMHVDSSVRYQEASALAAALEAVGARRARVLPGTTRLRLAAVMALVAVVAWLAWSRMGARPSPPTPEALASAPFDIHAAFLLRGPDGDRRLESGDRVAPGDRVSLEIRASRPVWVYVLDADERGECYLLFPQPLFDHRNPLPRDSSILLPGGSIGREVAWTVTSRGGREHLLVVASPEPVAELESELSRLRAPVPGRPIAYAPVAEGTVARLRGMGGVYEAPRAASPSGPTETFERIRLLAGADRGVRGTWVRQVVLENPLR